MVPETCGESWLSDWFARQADAYRARIKSFALQEGGDTATPGAYKVSDRGALKPTPLQREG